MIACVGGGSNAIGTFIAFVDDPRRQLVGVEAAGEGLETRRHSAPLTTGARGILHGALSAVLQDEEGQILEAHSVSAGLDYPGSGPEHAFLRDSGRVRYVAVPDADALAAFRRLAELEGILPALEPSHALAWVLANPGGGVDLLTLSGRGDKDLAEVLALSRMSLATQGRGADRGGVQLARQARCVDAVPDGRLPVLEVSAEVGLAAAAPGPT